MITASHATWLVAGWSVYQPMSMWLREISSTLTRLIRCGVVSAVVEGAYAAVGLRPGVGVVVDVAVGVGAGVGVRAPHPPSSRAAATMAESRTFTRAL